MNISIYNMKNYTEQFILFLEGLTENDYIDLDSIISEEINCNNVINYNNESQSQQINYTNLNPVFTSIEEWDHTNIKCWYCDSSFSNKPVFIPCNIRKTKDGDEMDTLGNFCSFNCAQAFINNDKMIPENKEWEYNKLLLILYKKFYKDKKINHIKPSPNKFKLIYYGGQYSYAEYRQLILNLQSNN